MRKILKITLAWIACFMIATYTIKCPNCDHICVDSCLHNKYSECISHNCLDTNHLIDEDDYIG